jgi:hypothetical protein
MRWIEEIIAAQAFLLGLPAEYDIVALLKSSLGADPGQTPKRSPHH